MTKLLEYRNEFLFIYEAKDCNPNGDPLDENRPRTDPETGVCTVTDVRIKRTIRDEILSWQPDEAERRKTGREILIRDTHRTDGFLSTGKDRADHFMSEEVKKAKGVDRINALQQKVLAQCIDARLFGSTLPVEKGSLKLTGPVQLSAFNRSLHRVAPRLIQQTAAFAGKDKAAQKSFAERHMVPYALIAAYGVCNEVAARVTQTMEEDLDLMFKALWRGTNNLATTSKMGHASLLLLRVQYLDGHKLGMLPQRVRMVSALEDEAIRGTDDYVLDVTQLVDDLVAVKDLIKEIEVQQDGRLTTSYGKEPETLPAVLQAVGLEMVS